MGDIKPRRRRSLMVRLVASFLVLSSLMVAVVGLVAYQRAKSSLQGTVFDRLGSASELKAGSVNRWLDEQRRNVVFAAGLLSGSNAYGGSLGVLNRQLAELLNPTSSATKQESHDSIDELLAYVVSETADAQEFMVLDPSGEIVVSTVPEHEGLSQANASYFTKGSSSTYVQPVSQTALADSPVIIVATPLFSHNGRKIAVLAAVLNLQRLDLIVLQNTGLGQSGQTYLVGTDGRFVHVQLLGQYPSAVHSEGIDQALRQHQGSALYTNYSGCR